MWWKQLVVCLVFWSACSQAQNSKDVLAKRIVMESTRTDDPFNLLSEEDLQSDWSMEGENSSLSEIKNFYHIFEEIININVRLVGFDDPRFKEADLSRYLDRMLQKRKADILENNETRTLSIARNFLFQISKAPSNLANDISKSVSEHLLRDVTLIPYSAIDSLVATDFALNSLSYTIYFLNLSVANLKPYSYSERSNEEIGIAGCTSGVWVGIDRYVWLDLTAAWPEFGPQIIGEGGVTNFIKPQTVRLNSSRDYQKLAVDMAELISLANEHLIAPSLKTYPIPHRPEINVHLIFIYDHYFSEDYDNKFDWNAITKQLSSVPIFADQQIRFKETQLSLLDCVHCSLARYNSLSSYATFGTSNSRLGSQTSYYIDSVELHKWLQQFRAEIGVDENDIPVFLFDLVDDNYLLDKTEQAVSFPDMVVAVQTQNNYIYTDFGCDGDTVILDASDATRAVLAALIQTIWGVSPTYLSWSPTQKKVVENYFWAVGKTPFGPFSGLTELSFSQRDAAGKNVLFTEIHQLLEELNSLFGHFLDFGKEIDEVLSDSEKLQFMRRWNVLRWKLDEAEKYLSLHSLNGSYQYIQTVHFDVTALHKLIHTAGQHLHTQLDCSQMEARMSATEIFFMLSPLLTILVLGIWFISKKYNKSHKE